MFEVLEKACFDIDSLIADSNASLKVYEDQADSNYGFACAIYQLDENPNQVIVSFKGTSGAADQYTNGGIAFKTKNDRLKQYIKAITEELIRPAYPHFKSTFLLTF